MTVFGGNLNKLKNVLIYDLPTRIFHWLFAGLFVSSFIIVQVYDDESRFYPYHMILGLILSATVILRVSWGILGSHYSRFTSFELNPLKLLDYLKNVFSTKSQKYLGHNPASSYAALLMMTCALLLAFTGFQMSIKNNKDFYEEIHEVCSNVFVVTAVLHILGIIIHTLKHRDRIALSMISGKKEVSDSSSLGISRQYVIISIVFVILISGFSLILFKNYNSREGTLFFLGRTLKLGDG